MPTVVSKDGTVIAYEKLGIGTPVILVDGALCYRDSGPARALAKELGGRFTVFTYDRRGRGESGNTLPYSPDREVEDLDALIREAGGSAAVYGISSGAALSLEAARQGLAIERLALYEAPFVVDGTYPPMADDYLPRLKEMVAQERRGDAVKFFLKRVGVPRVFLAVMPFTPVWSKLTAVAHTLVYDITIVEPYQKGRALPSAKWSGVRTPVLVMDGGKSPAWIRNGMRALAGALPGATFQTVEGQNHMVSARSIAPRLGEFFTA